MKVVGILSSLSGNKTRTILNEMIFPEEVDFEIIDLSVLKMSFADGRDYREYHDDTAMLVSKIIDADGLVIATPIYQASIPGVLKNVLDLLPQDSMINKTVGVLATAGSAHHYLVTQYHLLPVLEYMKMNVISKYVFVNTGEYIPGKINDEISMRIEKLVKDIVKGVEHQKELQEMMFDF